MWRLSRVRVVVGVLLILLFTAQPFMASPSMAQPVGEFPPVIIGEGANLYFIYPDGSTEQLTHNLLDGRGTLEPYSADDLFPSPDNVHLIWRDTPRFFEVAFNNREIDQLPPSDLYLLNRQTREVTTIAAHADVMTIDNETTLFYRSSTAMSWSPDGSMFAFIEIENNVSLDDTPAVRLQLFDLAAGTVRTLTEQIDMRLTWLRWLDAGILLTQSRDFVLYSPQDGAVIAQGMLEDGFYIKLSHSPVWIDDRSYLAIGQRGADDAAQAGIVQLFDPVTGEYLAATGTLAQVAAAAPETSLRLIGVHDNQRQDTIHAPDGTILWTSPTEAPFVQGLALSPDGDSFALYLAPNPDQIAFGGAGDIATIDYPTRGLQWGALIFTVVEPNGGALVTVVE